METWDDELSEIQEPPGEVFIRPAWYELYWLRAQLGLKQPMTWKSYLIILAIVGLLMCAHAYFFQYGCFGASGL